MYALFFIGQPFYLPHLKALVLLFWGNRGDRKELMGSISQVLVC